MQSRSQSRTPYSLQTPEWLVFLRLLCAFAEGTFALVVGVELTPACVMTTVLNDPARRVAVMGGREGMPRSLGSVYGGAVTRFLGGFRGVCSRTIEMTSSGPYFSSVAVSRDGSLLLITDERRVAHAVHIYSVHTGAFQQSIGGWGTVPLRFFHPCQVWVSADGFVFVVEWGNSRIQILTPQLDFHAFVGIGHLNGPHGVCADDDIIVVAHRNDDLVSVFKRGDGAFIRRFGKLGTSDGHLLSPTGVCFMMGYIAVADYENSRMSVWTRNGEFVRHIGVGQLKGPIGVSCSDAGELVIADNHTSRIIVLSASGEVVWTTAVGDILSVALHSSTIFGHMSGKCVVFS